MRLSLLLTLATILTYASESFALNQGWMFHKQSLQLKSKSLRSAKNQLTFDQKLDHFGSDSRTFKQRYFVDSQYATDMNSPVFYIICGEWNCAGVNSYSMVQVLAKKLKAHLVALEHRYYGESLPFNTLTTSNLKYLNLESAIEDMATFQRYMMDTKGFKGKWVAFGGSYAGTLTGFYRLKHPELIEGALASSAPVYMKAEFNEYDAHVAEIINKTSCGDKVREAVSLIEEKIKTPEGLQEVKTLFKSTDIKDTGDFMYVVADMLAAAVQYGRDKVFCESLTSSTDLIEGYAKGGLSVLTAMGAAPVEISMQSAEKVEVSSADYFRQWMWQSCSEFGWFQVANGTGKDTSRSPMIDLEYHANVCKRLYQQPMTADGSLNSHWYNSLFDSQTTRIIFSNGSNDPWLRLSVVDGSQSNSGLDLLMMEGAAHCNDLRAVTTLPSVLQGHARIQTIVESWLAQ